MARMKSVEIMRVRKKPALRKLEGRAQRTFRKWKTLEVVRLKSPIDLKGFKVDAEVKIWAEYKEYNQPPKKKPLKLPLKFVYKLDREKRSGRRRLRVQFEKKFYCFARLVAFAAKHPPGLTFKRYCSKTRPDGGSRNLYWEADHTNHDPDTILWKHLEVKSYRDNRAAAILHRQEKAKAAKAKAKLDKRRKR